MFLRPALRPGHPYLAGSPILAAHRGGAALAPENTLDAFRQAVDDYGADMLELDVRLTRDGQVVVVHDETVDRTTDGRGRVADLTLAEVRGLDAGARFMDLEGAAVFAGRDVRIPLLDEVLEAFPRTRLNVEAKCREVAVPAVGRIMAHGASHRVLLAAEHEKNRQEVRHYPGPRGASRTQIRAFHIFHRIPLGALYTPAADVLQVPESWEGRRIVTPRFIREAHRRNLPVHVWTVDDEAAMRRLLEMGVDAIQTDRPDILARVLHQESGRPLPRTLEAA